MNHRIDRRKLGRPGDQRRNLLHTMARQFIRRGYMRTTYGKAKELQRIVEKLISTGKKGTIAARRDARKILVGHSTSTPQPQKLLAGKTDAEKLEILQERSLINGEDLVAHLFDNVAPRFADRNGGYTRITKTGKRKGDAAQTAVLELVE